MLHFGWIGLLIFLPTFSTAGLEEFKAPKNPEECLAGVKAIRENLDKYQYLRNLQNQNEDLFYSCVIKNVNELLPIIYTPVVGEVCKNYARITGPRGLTLRITEQDKVKEKLDEWDKKHPGVRAIVVTDGGRILGLGDLGANGMGIPVGKMVIYSALGGVDPQHCLPVTLDVGTNKEDLRDSDLYVGLKQERAEGKVYEDFVDTFMKSVSIVFGARTLIQFEDFENNNAFKFLDKYREHYTTFNDDIQGTAAVALAGILTVERFNGKKLTDSKVLFAGAGEAGVGIANLMVEAMKEEGISEKDAQKKIFMKRSKQLIMDGDGEEYKDDDDRRLYRKTKEDIPSGANTESLVEIIKWLKPNILIGVSSKGGLFTKDVLEAMADCNDDPVIFPLSNPVEMSECTAEQAYRHTKGKALFASGSPFSEVVVDGRPRRPQQCNNAYIFPGVALAITATEMIKVPQKVFLIAAEILAKTCTQQEDFDQGSLFPKLERLQDCSIEIATAIAQYAFKNKLSDLKEIPKEEDVKKFIISKQYKPNIQASN